MLRIVEEFSGASPITFTTTLTESHLLVVVVNGAFTLDQTMTGIVSTVSLPDFPFISAFRLTLSAPVTELTFSETVQVGYLIEDAGFYGLGEEILDAASGSGVDTCRLAVAAQPIHVPVETLGPRCISFVHGVGFNTSSGECAEPPILIVDEANGGVEIYTADTATHASRFYRVSTSPSEYHTADTEMVFSINEPDRIHSGLVGVSLVVGSGDTPSIETLINENVITNCEGDGVRITNLPGVHISDNIITYGTGHSVYLDRCHNAQVRGNYLYLPDGAGVWFIQSSQVLVHGNYIVEPSQNNAGTYPYIHVGTNSNQSFIVSNRLVCTADADSSGPATPLTGIEIVGDVEETGVIANDLRDALGVSTTLAIVDGGIESQIYYNLPVGTTGIAPHTHTVSDITDFSEGVDDRVNDLLQAGTNITLTYNDLLNTLTIDAAGAAIAALDDIPDVNAPTPNVGDVLTWDGAAWVASPCCTTTTPGELLLDDDGSMLMDDGGDLLYEG